MPGHDAPKNVNICIFGADWCGYTRKQKEALRDQLDQDHATYVDCHGQQRDHALCKHPSMKGFPTTVVVEGDCADVTDFPAAETGRTFAGYRDASAILDIFEDMCREDA